MSSDAVRDMILTARMQAELAHHAYSGVDGISKVADKYGARWRAYRANHIEGAALFFSDHVHVTVCGSNDQYDWCVNRRTSMQTLGICDVHKGFADAAVWLAEKMIADGFGTFAYGKRLYIGGHSAGGAIAEMLPLYDRRFTPVASFTFGAPKWCESKSAAGYRAQPWQKHRFVMTYDPVPYLPLTLWRRALGMRYFTHIVKAFELHDEGTWEDADDIAAAERVGSVLRHTVTAGAANLFGWFRNYFRFPAHKSCRYFNAMQLAASEYQGV